MGPALGVHRSSRSVSGDGTARGAELPRILPTEQLEDETRLTLAALPTSHASDAGLTGTPITTQKGSSLSPGAETTAEGRVLGREGTAPAGHHRRHQCHRCSRGQDQARRLHSTTPA